MSVKLKEIREKIDQVDAQILSLLEMRFRLALMTKKLKTKVTDLNREKEVIDAVLKVSKKFGSLNQTFIKKIFKSIISESKRIQHQ